MRTKQILITLFLGIMATTAFSGHHEEEKTMQSSFADFEAFSQAMQGRWLSKIIWITDWPGFGKKGDEVTGYAEYQIAEGGKVLNGRMYAGPGTVTVIAYYDEGNKLIKETMVSSGGNVWNNTIFQRNGEWTYHVSGSTGDGKEITGWAKRVFTDDGKQHRWVGQWEIDGIALDPLRDSFRRIGN